MIEFDQRVIDQNYTSGSTPEGLIEEFEVNEERLEELSEAVERGQTVFFSTPVATRIRKLEDKYEHIADPPVGDGYEPLWDKATREDGAVRLLDTIEEVNSFLLFGLAEGDEGTVEGYSPVPPPSSQESSSFT
jgi:hypothetical protein